jgi:hypothetical protein
VIHDRDANLGYLRRVTNRIDDSSADLDDELVDPGAPEEPEEVDPRPVEIPAGALSDRALLGVINAFILQEGTDYGERETSHETKIEQIRRQLDRREISIVFDPRTATTSLVRKRDLDAFLEGRAPRG